MALIQCGECGKEVSDKAVSCPGCGAPISEPRVREEIRKEVGVQQVVIRNPVMVASEEMGRNIVKYFPVLVAIFAAIYIPYRIAMALGLGDDIETMPDWIGIVGMGIAIAAMIFGKFIRRRIGWIAALVLWLGLFYLPISSRAANRRKSITTRWSGPLKAWP